MKDNFHDSDTGNKQNGVCCVRKFATWRKVARSVENLIPIQTRLLVRRRRKGRAVEAAVQGPVILGALRLSQGELRASSHQSVFDAL